MWAALPECTPGHGGSPSCRLRPPRYGRRRTRRTRARCLCCRWQRSVAHRRCRVNPPDVFLSSALPALPLSSLIGGGSARPVCPSPKAPRSNVRFWPTDKVFEQDTGGHLAGTRPPLYGCCSHRWHVTSKTCIQCRAGSDRACCRSACSTRRQTTLPNRRRGFPCQGPTGIRVSVGRPHPRPQSCQS